MLAQPSNGIRDCGFNANADKAPTAKSVTVTLSPKYLGPLLQVDIEKRARTRHYRLRGAHGRLFAQRQRFGAILLKRRPDRRFWSAVSSLPNETQTLKRALPLDSKKSQYFTCLQRAITVSFTRARIK